MVCRLFGAAPLSQTVLNIDHTLGIRFQWQIDRNQEIFIDEIALQTYLFQFHHDFAQRQMSSGSPLNYKWEAISGISGHMNIR